MRAFVASQAFPFTMAAAVIVGILPLAAAEPWYAGKWDSTFTGYTTDMGLHPLTVVVRVEVCDDDTRLPITGAEVRLQGSSTEEVWRGSRCAPFPGLTQVFTVDKEFELRASTEDQGVAVFALRWQKRFVPGHTNNPDDIERVQEINVRKEGYKYTQEPLYFGTADDYYSHPETDPTSFWCDWGSGRGGSGWESWRQQVRYMRGAKYFQIDIRGVSFTDFPNEACTHPVLFEKVRKEQYDFEWPDMPVISTNPPERIGPFLMIPWTIYMKRVFVEVHPTVSPPIKENDSQQPSKTSEREPRVERPKLQDEQRLRDQGTERKRRLEEERQDLAKTNVLGLAVETYTQDRYGEIGYPYGTPPEMAVITAVDPSTSAAKEGLRPGDIIMQINTKGIANRSDFDAIVSNVRSGDQVLISYMRNLLHDQVMVLTRSEQSQNGPAQMSSSATGAISSTPSPDHVQQSVERVGRQQDVEKEARAARPWTGEVDVFTADFSGGSLDPSRWVVGGVERGVGGPNASVYKWSHTLVAGGGLDMRVQGPATGNSYGAEAWIRTVANFNNGQSHLLNFSWSADVSDGGKVSADLYAIQITDGSTASEDLFWYVDDTASSWNLYFKEHQADMGPVHWSIFIDPSSGTAKLYSGPDRTGTVLATKTLNTSSPWFLRFIMSDVSSAGYPAVDNHLYLYSFSASRE